MNIQTKFHGDQEINKEDIIIFPSGIPGFLEEKEFYIFPLEGTDLFMLQSVKTPEVAFIVTDPFALFPQYEFDLPKEAIEKLGIQSAKDVATFAILTVREPFQETTANLQAPIVINQTKKLGKQVIFNQTPYNTKHKIMAPPEQGGEIMLVLTRRLKESIIVGDDIEISILSIEGEQVKLGISAPKNIDIHRKEIYLSIQQENNTATKTEASAIEGLSSFFKKNKKFF